MSLKDSILNDVKAAMKAGEKDKLATLRILSSAIKQVEVDTRIELSDDEVVKIIQKEIKKRKESIKFAEDAGRQEMVDDNKKEISFLEAYLGDMISEEELRVIIKSHIDAGLDHIGKIMGALNKDHKGKFEGSLASSIIKELIG